MILRIIDKRTGEQIASGDHIITLPGHREARDEEVKAYYFMKKGHPKYKLVKGPTGMHRYVLLFNGGYIVVPMIDCYRAEFV